MTNREWFLKVLNDEVDDYGSSKSWIYYHVDCPYYCGDERTHCDKDHDPSYDRCAACKTEWLDMEVDE